MKLLKDIITFVNTLSFADLVFFFAVVVLMVLIVTLIYFIEINKDEEKDEALEETKEMQIVKEINKNITKETPTTIPFTDYEKDQENKAIISYEELLKKTNNYELNYEKEEYLDDLSVKKVDLDNLVSKKEEEKPKIEVRVISYAEEEAFLEALKRLQNNLG